ncbi:MAG: sigma 54-interacting transcriptional regulator [Candidatus Sulfotelmatobacter sp.]
MNYLGSDVETASMPAGEMHEFGVARSDQPAASILGAQVFTRRLMEADSAAHMSARHIKQVMDAVPQHMFILEPDGTLSFINRAAREYLGPIDTVTPTARLRSIINLDDVDELSSAYQDAMTHGISVEAEARVRNRNGQYRWFLHQLFPLHDVNGQIVRWCGTRIDIEDHKGSKEQAQRENLALREEINAMAMFEEIVGSAPRLQAVLARVTKVARTDSTVLITGETGTGKELIARAIHKRSDRANRPFVSVNCAAIPRDLIASELFGHEKGAFTGALQRRVGRFELAEGGTLFLDEIGELPAETQIALLRVLQEKEFQRVGSNQTIQAKVRVIAATHRDLPAAIEAGTFRSDLYYRINVFPLEVPALRDRQEDIPLLVEYFIDRYAHKTAKQIRNIGRKSMERLQLYPWPGNIRELQNVIERSVILCDSETFSVDESWLSTAARLGRPLAQEMVSQEKELIEAALAECKGRVSGASGAAAKLGMPPSTLDSKVRALKIDKRRFYTN